MEDEARHVAETKELADKLATTEVEHKLATQILCCRIGEFESDIQRFVGERDVALHHRWIRQQAEKAKEVVKKQKQSLEKKLKGESFYYL